MRVLVLSPYPAKLTFGASEVLHTPDPICPEYLRRNAVDFTVSYGYRHILDVPTLAVMGDRCCNLHISRLPWNRGSDPNFWSWFDATPKGVSMHVITKGLDTGPIIAQREMTFTSEETLATSYEKLHVAARELFTDTWPAFVEGKILPRPQTPSEGSYHRASDMLQFWSKLPKGYNTNVDVVREMGEEARIDKHVSHEFFDKMRAEIRAISDGPLAKEP